MVFDRVLQPFDLLIMTAHGSNLVTEHCVPKEAGATAASSSWTFRTSVHREARDKSPASSKAVLFVTAAPPER